MVRVRRSHFFLIFETSTYRLLPSTSLDRRQPSHLDPHLLFVLCPRSIGSHTPYLSALPLTLPLLFLVLAPQVLSASCAV